MDCINAKIPKPIIYPTTISHLLIGVDNNLSKVPLKRSLTKDTPDKMNTKKKVKKPIHTGPSPSNIVKFLEPCK
ncbi:Uncharacterised protein [Streptococcus pneumoniae]|nr:Uncharacterised protein [Streptococcus pneumoniae]CKH41845.1 Uncharacterised protein [Streptococcus pneumoniae]